MKYLLTALLMIIAVGFSAPVGNSKETMRETSGNRSITSKMKITIGNTAFTATLCDNPTAAAFLKMLPLTMQLKDLNANEKFGELPHTLVTGAKKPGTINAGDIMLYGASTLVLFYETFSSSYSYTVLGKIEDITGLKASLGTGNVTIRFEKAAG